MFGIGKEFFVFIYAILSGMFVMLSYQVICLFRCLISHRKWMIDVEDMAFWLLAAVYLFRQMYVTTNGNIRCFFAIGIFLGVGMIWGICFKVKRIYLKVTKKLEKENRKR